MRCGATLSVPALYTLLASHSRSSTCEAAAAETDADAESDATTAAVARQVDALLERATEAALLAAGAIYCTNAHCSACFLPEWTCDAGREQGERWFAFFNSFQFQCFTFIFFSIRIRSNSNSNLTQFVKF